MKKLIASLAMILVLVMPLAVSDDADMTVTVGDAASPSVDSVTISPDDGGGAGVQVNPTQNTDKEITITAVVKDPNGYEDIDTVTAEFTGTSIPTNGPDTGMSKTDCTNTAWDTLTCTKTFNMKFYDLPATDYVVTVTVKDFIPNQAQGSSDAFEYTSLKAFQLDASTIAFGTLEILDRGEQLGDTDMSDLIEPTVQNQGNVIIDIGMSGTDLDKTTAPTDSIDVEQAGYRFDSGSYIALTSSPVTEDVSVPIGATSYNKIDFELTVPTGALPGAYTGTVTVTAETNA